MATDTETPRLVPWWLWPAIFAASVAGFLAWMLTNWGGATVTTIVDDWGEFAAAAVAALLCARAAFRTRGATRRGWILMSAATGVWGAGEVVWSVNETVLHSTHLFPSLADVGFVLAVPLQIAAVLHLGSASRGRRVQTVLDGLIVSGALLYVSWVTVLRAVVAAGADSTLALVLSMTYPIGDVVTAVIVLSILSTSRRVAGSLVIVAAGLLCLAVSDSTFAYLSATTNFTTNPVNTGWVAGFLLIGLGALRAGQVGGLQGEQRLSRLRAMLPYVALLMAAAVGVGEAINGRRPDPLAISTSVVLVALVLGRQMLTLVQVLDLSRRLEVSLEALRQREELLEHQAFHDPLTNLANRALFANRVRHALARFRGERPTVAVMFLDMDDFKSINDSLGHDAGDRVIVSAAERLRACVRPGDTIARLGGDEFAVLLEDVQEAGDASRVAHRMLQAFRSPFELDREVFVSVSMGIAIPATPDATLESLVREADIAMYAAKGAGKARFTVYHSGMEGAPGERIELRAALYHAVARGEMTVHFQPVFDLAGGAAVGAEALVRWRRGRDILPPRVFLPIAEEAGLVGLIGRQVLEVACEELARWNRLRGRRDLFVSVNVAASQMATPGFAAEVAEVVEATGVDPSQVVLEMVEETFMHAPEAERALAELAATGVRLSLDNFGGAQASLARLPGARPSFLKLDRALVAGLSDASGAAVAESLIKLCAALGISSLAEAVERPEQLERLRALGCGLAQGNLLQAATTAEAVRRLLARSEDRVGALLEGGVTG